MQLWTAGYTVIRTMTNKKYAIFWGTRRIRNVTIPQKSIGGINIKIIPISSGLKKIPLSGSENKEEIISK